jgi:hemerythrin
LIDSFTEIWGERKEHSNLLANLNSIMKNENETMEEFNKRFNELINIIHKDIKPPDASILNYYGEAFSGEMCYQLRDKEP